MPRELVWDNESAVGSWRAGKPKLTDDFEAFRGTLGVAVHQCRPRDPEAKGMVERANGYLETSFLPGRTFTSPADFNTQLGEWLELANTRIVRRIGCAPDRIGGRPTRRAMLSLPPVAPSIGWRTRVRLPRDHYVRLDSNDYSVDPAVVGRSGRGPRGPEHGHRDLRREGRRLPPAVLGQAPDDHRPGPSPGSPAARVTKRPHRPAPAAPESTRCSSVTWAPTTPRSA